MEDSEKGTVEVVDTTSDDLGAPPGKRALEESEGASDFEPEAKRAKSDFSVPSKVIFLRNIDLKATEADLSGLCGSYGTVQNVLYLFEKHQAFVEMSLVDESRQIVEYYGEHPPPLQ
jgi:hypothetical protein